MAILSSTLAWKTPCPEDPGRLQSTGSQRVGHDWGASLSLSRSLQLRGDAAYGHYYKQRGRVQFYFAYIFYFCFPFKNIIFLFEWTQLGILDRLIRRLRTGFFKSPYFPSLVWGKLHRWCRSAICSVMSDSLWSCGLQPARLLCPWDSPGKNTGAGCHCLLQGSSWPRDRTWVSCFTGRCFTIWTTTGEEQVKRHKK